MKYNVGKFLLPFVPFFILSLPLSLLATSHWATVDDSKAIEAQAYPWGMAINNRDEVYVFGFVGFNWVVRKSDLSGHIWKNSDVYQLARGHLSRAAHGVAFGSFVIVTGTAIDVNGQYHMVIRGSRDNGVHWKTLDNAPSGPGTLETRRLAINPLGHIYSVGGTYDSNTNTGHSFVRKSLDWGRTWSTVDFSKTTKDFSFASGVGFDVLGRVYITGCSDQSKDNQCAYHDVLRSSDGGRHWESLDHTILPGEMWLFPTTLRINSSQQIFTVGSHGTDFLKRNPFVRVSSDLGKTWAMIPDSLFPGTPDTVNYEIRNNARGQLFVLGKSTGEKNDLTWFIKMLTSEGWKFLDIYRGTEGLGAWPTDLVFNSKGEIYVCGLYTASKALYRWVVRKLEKD